jgi:hypothetical protein
VPDSGGSGGSEEELSADSEAEAESEGVGEEDGVEEDDDEAWEPKQVRPLLLAIVGHQVVVPP